MKNSIYLLIKLDATHLFDRVKDRLHEYVVIMSIKQSRDHLKEIFKNIYDTITVADLKEIDPDVLIVADEFYNQIDKLKWYLFHTQDLPNAIEDHVTNQLHKLEISYQTMALYLDAKLSGGELSTLESEEADVENFMVDESTENPM